ncbi:DUF3168 domain-containing protein [Maritimibacter sp. DP1N21-5]|uniref:tail completion protein gp17 n=1 Tax=Maritimibacter sp. DP1N21-5 TaxID=2836867 RepID=UPI001C489B78|nr:DUF3168 domain-containing protein [Maritimibacter sp. DP1N21-5]MBV7408203.1 DUF3168 domain-containing protein [Maritimibacter sp. DP1N21-5]
MKAALTSLLLADPDLEALVGTRVHWLTLPPGEAGAPYLILQEISEVEPMHLEGPTGLRFARLQTDAWGERLADAVAVADAIEDLLNGYAAVSGGIRFERITKEMRRDIGPVDADGTRILSRVSMDFEVVWSKET